MQASEFRSVLPHHSLLLLLPFSRNISAPVLSSTILALLCCLLFIMEFHHIVQFSRCSFQPLLRSDFSTQTLAWILKSKLTLGLVGQSGLEPPTSRLSVVCSSQLSYWPASSQAPYPSLLGKPKSSLIPLPLLFLADPLRWAPLGF